MKFIVSTFDDHLLNKNKIFLQMCRLYQKFMFI